MIYIVHLVNVKNVQCSFYFFASGCDEFTVDSCNPDPSQTINTVVLPNNGEQTGICQDLCDKQTVLTGPFFAPLIQLNLATVLSTSLPTFALARK